MKPPDTSSWVAMSLRPRHGDVSGVKSAHPLAEMAVKCAPWCTSPTLLNLTSNRAGSSALAE